MTDTAERDDDMEDEDTDEVEDEGGPAVALEAVVVREPVVLVGVDGSEHSLHALEWAARYAQAMKLTVRCLSAWMLPVDYGSGMAITEDVDLQGAAAHELAESVAAVRSRYPGVDFEAQVVNDQAAPALVDAAKRAELLVVGASGHGELMGALLGSVSAHCVHHAEVPVVVVR